MLFFGIMDLIGVRGRTFESSSVSFQLKSLLSSVSSFQADINEFFAIESISVVFKICMSLSVSSFIVIVFVGLLSLRWRFNVTIEFALVLLRVSVIKCDAL